MAAVPQSQSQSQSAMPITSSMPEYQQPNRQPATYSLVPRTDNMPRSQARTSVRYSTYSMAPSFTPTVQTSNSAHAEIRDIATGLDRMENKALSSQRVSLTEDKVDNLQKLALGAKLERALGRRMSGQDAVMRPRRKNTINSEKTLVEKVQ